MFPLFSTMKTNNSIVLLTDMQVKEKGECPLLYLVLKALHNR